MFPKSPREQHLIKSITIFWPANNVFPPLQSAYRKHHSTETALLKVINDIHVNMNNQQVTLLVFLDLSSAFDTVDHDILINRIQTSFGITDTALLWLKSYLSGRSIRVIIDESTSESLNMLYGVPQGSCLAHYCLPFMLANSLKW